MNELTWFWILSSIGIMLFLIQAGFALILRAERSGGVQKKKKEFVGSVLEDEPLAKVNTIRYIVKNGKK